MNPVTIVGGGLAGLTLGIGLRRQDVPVTIHEAAGYPRHRVCGEFISGRGQETLDRLHLRPLLDEAGAISAKTVAFFSATRSTAPRPLPSPALCLSRYDLDAALANEFKKLGGDLRTGERWRGTYGEGMIRATGRRLPPESENSRWFGLKIHATEVPLVADLEMHLSHRGYVGLCRVNSNAVNVCGLFRRTSNEPTHAANWREWLCGASGSPLHARLAQSNFDERSFCAVAGLYLAPQRAERLSETSIGDAITMIPPVTGNGMSMAFESAELAMEPIIAWSRGEIAWAEVQQRIAGDCDRAFRRRLVWANWLQWAILSPSLQNPLLTFAAENNWFWRTAFAHTR